MGDKVKATYQELTAKIVNLGLLRKLEDAGCVSGTGLIQGRLEEDYEGVPIWDTVREALVMEESGLYDTFDEKDRREFLLHIFKRLILGGAMCQYDTCIKVYSDLTKKVYKDLATVRKNDAGDLEVVSWPVQVTSIGRGGHLFPKMDRELQNFCYLSIDPIVRHV